MNSLYLEQRLKDLEARLQAAKEEIANLRATLAVPSTPEAPHAPTVVYVVNFGPELAKGRCRIFYCEANEAIRICDILNEPHIKHRYQVYEAFLEVKRCIGTPGNV
jgi:hypothetical protein